MSVLPMMLFLVLMHNISSNEECIDQIQVDIDEWFQNEFNNHFKHEQIDLLPVDEQSLLTPDLNHIPKQVSNAIFSIVNPVAISNPKLVSVSEKAFNDSINLRFPSKIKDELLKILTKIVSGDASTMKQYIPNIIPYAHCYCGHQFGYFAGQLGDGRAISLGEFHFDDNNDETKICELQLKGSGKTPFSRKGDGRAVLRSSIREYLMAEYMANINVPTSRAAMLVTSLSDTVNRDVFYNGNIKPEPIAIVLRLAPNWIRFGSFELHLSKNGRNGPMYHESFEKQYNLSKSLLDHVIKYHYTKTWKKYIDELTDINMYESWWIQLVERNIKLVSRWQCIGFVHGVLNTDNLSIMGIGIDYGPFGMMEYFDDDYIPNYSDESGRYSYNKQVEIFKWNLLMLAQSLDKLNLLPLSITSKYLENEYFDQLFNKYYYNEMRQKFGLIYNTNHDRLKLLLNAFIDSLKESVCDWTNSWRALNKLSINGINECNEQCDDDQYNDQLIMAKNRKIEDDSLIEYLVKQCVNPSHYKKLQKRKHMIRTHTDYNINNNKNTWIANMNDIEKKKYDIATFTQFVALYRGYVDSEWDYYKEKKLNMKQLNDQRMKLMNNINPKYILRNHFLQKAIEDAENGDYSEIEKLLSMINDPFNDNEIYDGIYDKPISEQVCDSFGSCDILSCSS